MRTIAAIAMLAMLVACGDDDDDNGGAGGGTNVTLSGTIAGSLTNGTGARVAGSCDPGIGQTVSFAAAIIGVSTAPNLCAAVTAAREPPNATTLFISLSKIATTATSTTLDPGTYTLFTGIPAPDAQGNVRIAFIGAEQSGGPAGAGQGCTTVADAEATAGSVTLTSASETGFTGSVTATLSDGTTASGSFSVATCGIALSVDPDTCDILGIPDSATCG